MLWDGAQLQHGTQQGSCHQIVQLMIAPSICSDRCPAPAQHQITGAESICLQAARQPEQARQDKQVGHYAASWGRQFTVLAKRHLLGQLRNPTDSSSRLLMSCYVGLLAGAPLLVLVHGSMAPCTCAAAACAWQLLCTGVSGFCGMPCLR